MEHYEEFRDLIYDLASGNINLNAHLVPESEIVKNEFGEGCKCTEAYNRMLDAYTRLCDRLDSPEWEDPDVEVVINALLDIGHHLALKMFDYGQYFALNGR